MNISTKAKKYNIGIPEPSINAIEIFVRSYIVVILIYAKSFLLLILFNITEA